MRKLILFIMATITVMVAGAQTLLYQNDSIKIIGDTAAMMHNSSSIVNYDNDGNWANLNGKIVNYDDTLGIIKSFPADNYEYKYDNKFYTIRVEWKYINNSILDDSTTWFDTRRTIDSIYLSVYNNGNITNYTLPQLCNYSDTSLDFTNIKFVMTPNHNFVLSMSYKQDTIMVSKLFKIDRNGYVIKASSLLYDCYVTSMDYNSKDLLLSNFNVPFNGFILTTFDQDSLIIKSSKTIPSGNTMCCINDSLIFLTDYDSDFYIYNTNTDSCITYKLRYSTYSIWVPWGSFNSEKNKNIFVNNINDIYLAFYTSYVTGSFASDSSRGIEIINFDAYGNTKKVVTFNEYLPSFYKGVRGLACAKDSNLILVVNTSPMHHEDTTNIGYIMKYSIKGSVVSINQVDIEESKFTLYPNPINDKLNIIGDYDNIEVIDYIGKIVYISGKSDTYDLSKLKPGYYFVKIYKDDKVVMKKIIKQ